LVSLQEHARQGTKETLAKREKKNHRGEKAAGRNRKKHLALAKSSKGRKISTVASPRRLERGGENWYLHPALKKKERRPKNTHQSRFNEMPQGEGLGRSDIRQT